MNKNNLSLTIKEILNILPHRFPFLLIDKVIEFRKWVFLKSIHNVSFSSPFFQGHFPNNPIMPGVLIIESIAQATGILILKSIEKIESDKLYYLASIDNAKFKHPARPGDQIIIEIVFIKKRFNIFKFKGIAKVNKTLICRTLISCAHSRNNK